MGAADRAEYTTAQARTHNAWTELKSKTLALYAITLHEVQFLGFFFSQENSRFFFGGFKKRRFLCRNAQKEKIEPDLFNEGFEAVAEGAHSAVIGIERDNLLEVILRFSVVGFFIVDFVEAE